MAMAGDGMKWHVGTRHAQTSLRLSGDWPPDNGCPVDLALAVECACARRHAHACPTCITHANAIFDNTGTHANAILDNTGTHADGFLHTIAQGHGHGNPYTLFRFERDGLRRD